MPATGTDSTAPPTAVNRTHERRRIKLIKPRLQLRLIGIFLGLTALALLLQFLLLASQLSQVAIEMPQGGPYLAERTFQLLTEILALSFALALPVTFLIGRVITFRIAGPVYRFERFLREVELGIEHRPCRLREGDELQELCERLNEATRARRAENRAREAALEAEDAAREREAR